MPCAAYEVRRFFIPAGAVIFSFHEKVFRRLRALSKLDRSIDLSLSAGLSRQARHDQPDVSPRGGDCELPPLTPAGSSNADWPCFPTPISDCSNRRLLSGRCTQRPFFCLWKSAGRSRRYWRSAVAQGRIPSVWTWMPRMTPNLFVTPRANLGWPLLALFGAAVALLLLWWGAGSISRGYLAKRLEEATQPSPR